MTFSHTEAEHIPQELSELQKYIGEKLGVMLGVGWVLLNKDGTCLWICPFVRQILQRAPALSPTQTGWLSLIHPDDVPLAQTNWQHCQTRKKPVFFESRLALLPTEHWFKFRLYPYEYQETHAGFLLFLEDITLLRIKEEELYLQADLLAEIHEAVIVLDIENKVKYWNNGAEKLYGILADNIVGKKLREAFEYRWPNSELKEKARTELAEEGHTHAELVHLCRDGRKRYVEVSMHLNYDKSTGERNGTTSIVRDITEKKEAETDLKKTYRYIRLLLSRAEEENQYLKQGVELHEKHNFENIVTQSEDFKNILAQVEQVASSDATVLILGETGTGKELLAKAVHNRSPRADSPMVKVNCAALPSELIESELFGHEKGAFTGAVARKIGRFEFADGGSIFLDEIGELPLELQAKLLRVLQEGEYERLGSTQTLKTNVRIIAATNRDLLKEVKAGRFRADLYYRLNVFPIQVPALRERREDIPLLAHYFVKKYSKTIGKEIDKIPKKVMQQLEEYDWPGNIRELENIIERAIIVSSGKSLQIGNWLGKDRLAIEQENFVTLAEKEIEYITAVLKKVNWKISGPNSAAEILGMRPTTLRSRMEKLGIQRPF